MEEDDADGLDWLVSRRSPKRKHPNHLNGDTYCSEKSKAARGIRHLRNWHLGIPNNVSEGEEDTEDDDPYGDDPSGIPPWASTSASCAAAFAEDGESEFARIGLAPEQLHFQVDDFSGKVPLRQDGSNRKEKDDLFYGEQWKKEYLSRLDALHENKDYIWLQLLAGATNTTTDNLLSIKDLETRALRSRVVLEKQSADIRARFSRINTIRAEVTDAREDLNREKEKLEKTSLARAEADRAAFNLKLLKQAQDGFERAEFTEERLQDYVFVNEEFANWIIASKKQDLTRPEVEQAISRRLSSIGRKPINSSASTPGLRGLSEEELDTVRQQAIDLLRLNETGGDKINSLIFLGMWILYETRTLIVENLTLPKDTRDELLTTIETNIKGILTKTKAAPVKLPDDIWEFKASDAVSFASLQNFAKANIKRFFTEKLSRLLYETPTAPSNKIMSTILSAQLADTRVVTNSLFVTMVDDAVEAMRFVNGLPPSARFGTVGRKRYDVFEFQNASVDNVKRRISRIVNDLQDIVSATSEDTESIRRAIRSKEEALTKARLELDTLLTTPLGPTEPDLPYRPEGEWVLDPINTGRIQPVPIVLKGISEAYQKVAKFVPHLAPGNPRDPQQRKANIEVLQHDLRYQDDFINLVARFMGISRQAFNVRWMPDLLGNHKQVIAQSIKNLRMAGDNGIDAAFSQTLREL